MNKNTLKKQNLRKRRVNKLMAVLGIVVIMAMISIVPAFAATSETIQQGIKTGTKEVYDIMTAVIIPIAVISFAWCGYKALFGGERGMEQAKKFLITIVVVLALVYLAPLAVEQVSGWFQNIGTGSVFS